MPDKVNETLSALMEKHGKTRNDMAKGAGITSGMFASILRRDIKCPPVNRLRGFSRVLGEPLNVIQSAFEGAGCAYNGQVLNEIWLSVAGSHEDDIARIEHALRLKGRNEEKHYRLEVTMPNKIIVRVRDFDSDRELQTAFQADWGFAEDGKVIFDNWEEVTLDIVARKKEEASEMVEMLEGTHNTTRLDEILPDAQFVLEAAQDDKPAHGRVAVAQKAGIINRNRRRYPLKVLQEAVTAAKAHIAKFGPMPIDVKHRVSPTGKVETDFTQICGGIYDLELTEAGELSLSDVRFTSNIVGQEIRKLYEDGFRFTVSQRGRGETRIINEATGIIEEVVSLTLEGFDLIKPGRESVQSPGNILLMEESMPNVQQIQDMIQNTVSASIQSAMQPLLESQQTQGPEPEAAPEAETPSSSQDGSFQELSEQLSEHNSKTAQLEAELRQIRLTEKQRILSETSSTVISDALADDKYDRFSDKLKAEIAGNIDPSSVVDKVDDVSDKKAVLEAVQPLISAEVSRVDRYLSQVQLASTGYPNQGSGDGIVHVQVGQEFVPGMERIKRLEESAERMLKSQDPKAWIMPNDHPSQKLIENILKQFDQDNYKKLLLEANEEVTQSDIGVRMASMARAVIPVAFRRMTALDVCDVGMMSRVTEDILIEEHNPSEGGNITDDISLLMPGEQGTIATEGYQTTGFPMHAVKIPVRTFVTQEARAITRGTPIADVEGRSVANMGKRVGVFVDRLLWQIHVTGAQLQAYTEQTAWTALTKVGSTDEWSSPNQGWMRYEILKTVDANNNPTAAKLGALFGAPAGNVLQDVQVREAAGDQTVLTYGTDYSINYPDGTITLTASGVTEEAGNGLEAKYTYTTNAAFWSKVPPVGVDLYHHIINLRQRIGDAKVLIEDRQYEPSTLGFAPQIAELVTSGPIFTNAGGTPADLLSQMNDVMRLAGLEPVRTSALTVKAGSDYDAWIPVFVRGSVAYRSFIPPEITGPIVDETNGNRYFLSEQWSAQDVPKKEKLALVGVTDLGT